MRTILPPNQVLGFALFLLASCTEAPASDEVIASEVGIASYYSDHLDGGPTASGEVYDHTALTAAHPNLPFNTRVRVTNLRNGKSVVVRINDRGPFIKGRVIDVSGEAAKRLKMKGHGLVKVRVDVLKQPAPDLTDAPETSAP